MTTTECTVLTAAKVAYYEERAREVRLAAWGSLFRWLSGRIRHPETVSAVAAKAV